MKDFGYGIQKKFGWGYTVFYSDTQIYAPILNNTSIFSENFILNTRTSTRKKINAWLL